MILRISGVCQPISKILGDPLPVWGNPNLIFNQCPWCISSYGWLQLWTQWQEFEDLKKGQDLQITNISFTSPNLSFSFLSYGFYFSGCASNFRRIPYSFEWYIIISMYFDTGILIKILEQFHQNSANMYKFQMAIFEEFWWHFVL